MKTGYVYHLRTLIPQEQTWETWGDQAIFCPSSSMQVSDCFDGRCIDSFGLDMDGKWAAFYETLLLYSNLPHRNSSEGYGTYGQWHNPLSVTVRMCSFYSEVKVSSYFN